MSAFKPFPEVRGQQITREDVIEGLRDGYTELCQLKRRLDPTFARYPDMEVLLDHIEEHGIPPKEV